MAAYCIAEQRDGPFLGDSQLVKLTPLSSVLYSFEKGPGVIEERVEEKKRGNKCTYMK
jgi:hypothetical protein